MLQFVKLYFVKMFQEGIRQTFLIYGIWYGESLCMSLCYLHTDDDVEKNGIFEVSIFTHV